MEIRTISSLRHFHAMSINAELMAVTRCGAFTSIFLRNDRFVVWSVSILLERGATKRQIQSASPAKVEGPQPVHWPPGPQVLDGTRTGFLATMSYPLPMWSFARTANEKTRMKKKKSVVLMCLVTVLFPPKHVVVFLTVFLAHIKSYFFVMYHNL